MSNSFFVTDKDLRKGISKKPTHNNNSVSARLAERKALLATQSTPTKEIPIDSTPIPSKPSETSTLSLIKPENKTNTQDILDLARLEREKRHSDRAKEQFIIRIQAWYRCRKTASQHFTQCFQRYQQKLFDIQKVIQLMKMKNMVFIPPMPILLELFDLSCYLLRYVSIKQFLLSDYLNILLFYLQDVFLPSLQSSEPTKNFLLSAMNNSSLDLFHKKWFVFVQLLFKQWEQVQLTYLKPTKKSFSKSIVLSIPQQNILLSFYSYFIYPTCLNSSQLSCYYQQIKVISSHSLILTPWKPFITSLITFFCQIFLPKPEVDTLDSYSKHLNATENIQQLHLIPNKTANLQMVLILNSLINFLFHGNLGEQEEKIDYFMEYILTIPCFTCLFSNSQWLQVFQTHSIHWKFFFQYIRQHFVDYLTSFMDVLLVNPTYVKSIPLTNGVIILGNYCYLFPIVFQSIELCTSIDNLFNFMEILTQLLMLYALPLPLQGLTHIEILQHTLNTTNYHAINIPYLYTLQLLCLYDMPTQLILLTYTFPNYHTFPSLRKNSLSINWSRYQQESIQEDIHKAMLSNSMFMIQNDLYAIDTMNSSSKTSSSIGYLASKWAKKLGFVSSSTYTKVSGESNKMNSNEKNADNSSSVSSSSKSNKNSNNKNGWFSSFFSNSTSSISEKSTSKESIPSKSTLPPINSQKEANTTNKTLSFAHELEQNPQFLHYLHILWLFLLPFGSSSSLDSIPSKFMTSLVFSTPIFELLWLTILSSSSTSTMKDWIEQLNLNFFYGKMNPYQMILQAQKASTTYKSSSSPSIASSLTSIFSNDSQINSNVFCYVHMVHLLTIINNTLDDLEFYEEHKPLPLHQMYIWIQYANELLYSLIRISPLSFHDLYLTSEAKNKHTQLNTKPNKENPTTSMKVEEIKLIFIQHLKSILRDFHTRWIRRPFTSLAYWQTLPELRIYTGGSSSSFIFSSSSTSSSSSASSQKDLHQLIKTTNLLELFYLNKKESSSSSTSLYAPHDLSKKLTLDEFQLKLYYENLLYTMPWIIKSQDKLLYLRCVLDDERYQIQGIPMHIQQDYERNRSLFNNLLQSFYGLTATTTTATFTSHFTNLSTISNTSQILFHPFLQSYTQYTLGYQTKGIHLQIHKESMLHDTLTYFHQHGLTSFQWKDRIIIHYYNTLQRQEEMGIDVGGLFKDFMTFLSQDLFHPKYGLFTFQQNDTNSNNNKKDSTGNEQLLLLYSKLFPNPKIKEILFMFPMFSSSYSSSSSSSTSSSTTSSPTNNHTEEIERLYYIIGCILGKACYENITISIQFISYFLSFFNTNYNFLHLIDDLYIYDMELYKNLLFLKTYDGDISDLGLTFSVMDESFGVNKEIELISNGKNIEVNSRNRFQYIQLVAKYYLHDRIKIQSKAFFRGFYTIIPYQLANVLSGPELQSFISGTPAQINLKELQTYTQYIGYTSMDRYIHSFWKILQEEFNEEDIALFLLFVTACPRPPSLGFQSLSPLFTIQKISNEHYENIENRLPTASTCFNTLKLPYYSSTKVLKEKLLYAIRSKSGFDLS